jgi:hypothetical protein
MGPPPFSFHPTRLLPAQCPVTKTNQVSSPFSTRTTLCSLSEKVLRATDWTPKAFVLLSLLKPPRRALRPLTQRIRCPRGGPIGMT